MQLATRSGTRFTDLLLRVQSSRLQSINQSSSTVENNSSKADELLKSYSVLDIQPTCSKIELKSRYLHLVKRFHPDSGGEAADTDRFQKVRSAYKFIVENDFSETDQADLKDVPNIFDIRHTAPQHRQYLEFGGIGYGTPSQRMKQYQQHRVQSATENVREFMINKIIASETDELIVSSNEEAEYVRKWKTRNAMDRLVEDLIQESMKKGEFDNLPGKGKPLRPVSGSNPYVDATTQKLNQILVQNGFCPPWILQEKEIKQDMRRIREEIFAQRMVPAMSRQIIPISYEREIKRAMEKVENGKFCDRFGVEETGKPASSVGDKGTVDSKAGQETGIFKSLLSAMHLK